MIDDLQCQDLMQTFYVTSDNISLPQLPTCNYFLYTVVLFSIDIACFLEARTMFLRNEILSGLFRTSSTTDK